MQSAQAHFVILGGIAEPRRPVFGFYNLPHSANLEIDFFVLCEMTAVRAGMPAIICAAQTMIDASCCGDNYSLDLDRRFHFASPSPLCPGA